MRAMMELIVEVVDANQETINAKGVGFKGFIPAVFGRLIGEAFARNAEGEAEIKVTAPAELVRNRKARPDSWEASIIKAKLLAPDWPRGNPYSAMADAKGRPAYRVMVPEYYAESCLTCHGSPKGRDGHHRLSERRRQGRRSGRGHQHYPVPLTDWRCTVFPSSRPDRSGMPPAAAAAPATGSRRPAIGSADRGLVALRRRQNPRPDPASLGRAAHRADRHECLSVAQTEREHRRDHRNREPARRDRAGEQRRRSRSARCGTG